MSVGERRRWAGLESRPFSSRGPSTWSSQGRIWAVSTRSEEPSIRSDPCDARVSAISGGFESRPIRSTRCGNRNVSPGKDLFWPVSAGRPGRALSNPCDAGSGLRHCQSSRFTASLDDKIEPAHESLQQPAEHTAVRAEPLLPYPTYRRPDAIGQRRDLPRSGSSSSVLSENWRSVRVITANGVLMRIQ